MPASGSTDDGDGLGPATAHTPRPPDAILLFLHGLESGPHGSKARYLQNAFPNNTVLIPDMEMSAVSPVKRNSFLRNFGCVRWSMDGCVQLVLEYLKDELGRLLGGESAAGGGLEEPPREPEESSASSSRSSSAFALEELFSEEEQELISSRLVVVGSSWGGAVGCALLEAGLRPCRAVLLAPALSVFGLLSLFWPDFTPQRFFREQAESVGRDRTAEGVGPRHTELLVLHGDCDTTVPVEGSRALARQFGARLQAAAGAEGSAEPAGGVGDGAAPAVGAGAEGSGGRESFGANGGWFRYEEVAGGDHRLNAALIDTGRLARVIAE